MALHVPNETQQARIRRMSLYWLRRCLDLQRWAVKKHEEDGHHGLAAEMRKEMESCEAAVIVIEKSAVPVDYDRVINLLDDVSATLENVLLHYHPDNIEKKRRSDLCQHARKLCDEQLRSNADEEEDEE